MWQVELMSREDTWACWVVLIKVDSYWETHIELQRRRRSTIRCFTHESGMFPFICFAPQRSKVVTHPSRDERLLVQVASSGCLKNVVRHERQHSRLCLLET